MSPTHYSEFRVSCPSCGKWHTLTLTDDIPLSERITCTSCKTDMAKVGDLLTLSGNRKPPPKSSGSDNNSSQPGA
jgi:hypothetical protein